MLLAYYCDTQKQSFGRILWNRYFQTFRKIHRKTTVPESLFLQYSRPSRKEIPAQVFAYKIFEIFKNIFFEEHLRTANSGYEVFPSNFLHIIWNFSTMVFYWNNQPLFDVCAWLSYETAITLIVFMQAWKLRKLGIS